MKYKLKRNSKGEFLLHVIEIIGTFGILFCVIQYFASISPNNSSEINYFVFVAVLTIGIAIKAGNWFSKSSYGIINLFEEKKK